MEIRVSNGGRRATIALPAIAHADDTQYANFLSPTGNINCQTVTYQLEMALNADQGSPVGEGKSAINVALTDPANPSRNRLRDAVSLHISVEP